MLRKPHKNILVGIGVYLLCTLGIISFILNSFRVNSKYNEMFDNTVSFEKGIIDLSAYEGNDKETVRFLGEAEFFYNTWLISDSESGCKPDGYLKFSDCWTSIKKDGKALPKTGYGSYRFIVKNSPRDFNFNCYEDMYSMPWRAFVDGHLVCSAGTMSKILSENSVSTDEIYYEDYLCKSGEDHEIVIEVGANDSAGRIVPNRLVFTDESTFIVDYEAFFKTTDNIANMAMGLLLASLIFLLLFALISKNYWVSVSYGLIMIAIILTLGFSIDYFRTLQSLLPAISWATVEMLQYGIALFTLCVLFWHLHVSKLLHFRQKETVLFLSANLVLAILTVLSNGYNIQISVVIAHLFVYNYLILKLFSGGHDRLAERIAYTVLIYMLNLFYLFEAWDYTGSLVYKGSRIYSYELMILMLGIITIYLAQIRRVQQKALTAEKMEKEKSVFEAQVLKSQIKPHFVFNTLTMIISKYRTSLDDGEKALRLMADYMRTNVDASRKELVPFEEELKAADTYFDLCNIRKEGILRLYHDIEVYDFEIPLMSLQPLLENAVKYSCIEKKKDGYISIGSHEDDRYIYVEVDDNGVGFDPRKIRDGAVGLQNARDRLRLLIRADMTIETKINVGTKVVIRIPKGEKPE